MSATKQVTKIDGTTVFEAKTSDVVDLKRLLKTLSNLVNETPVELSADGVRFLTADPAMVGMMDVVLRPEMFGRFEYDDDQPTRFKIDVDELYGRVSEAKKGDRVTLSYRHKGHGEYAVDVKVWHDGITSTFTLDAGDADESDVPSQEELEFTGSALVALPMFRAAIQKMGSSIELVLDEDQIVMQSDTDDGTARVRFPDGSDHLHAVNLADGGVRSLYAKDYLEMVKSLRKTVKRVQLQFGTDFPLKLSVDEDRFAWEYIVAPRIEED